MLNINTNFVSGRNNLKQQKQQSFGMNPISKTKDKITSTLRPLTSDVYQIGNSIASSNSQQNLQQQNLNYTYSNIELVEVINDSYRNDSLNPISQATLQNNISSNSQQNLQQQNLNSDSNNIEPIEIIIGSQQNDSLNAISSAPLQNNLNLTHDEADSDDELYEKDMEADKYFNNCCNTFSKALSIIPVIGFAVALQLGNALGRNNELDKIYGVPEYIPVKFKENFTDYWFATACLQLCFFTSIIGTPMAICGLFLNKKAQNNVKKGYHEAYKKEQEQAKNETPYQTKLRHQRLEGEYEEKRRQQAEAVLDKVETQYRPPRHYTPKPQIRMPQRTGG